MSILHLAKKSPLENGGVERVVYHWMINVDNSLCLTNDFTFFRSFQGEIVKISLFCFLRLVFQCDKVVLHWPNLSIFLLPFFLFLKPYIFYHADIVSKPKTATFFLNLSRYLLGFKASYICHNNEYFISSTQVNSDCIVITNPCDEIFFGGDNNFKKYDLLFIGRNVPYKGLSLLKTIAINRPELKIAIISSGVKECPDNCHIFENCDDQLKDLLIKSSKFLILPSINRAEAFGIVLIEAKANGLPVIVSDASEGVTFVAGGFDEGGFVFSNLNIDSALLSIDKALSFSDFEYSLLSKNAFRDYHARFSYSIFKDQLNKFTNL